MRKLRYSRIAFIVFIISLFFVLGGNISNTPVFENDSSIEYTAGVEENDSIFDVIVEKIVNATENVSDLFIADDSKIIENDSEKNKTTKNHTKEIKFAVRINNKTELSFEDEKYLAKYKNFSDKEFVKLVRKDAKISFKAKSSVKNFMGVIIDSKKYMIDVMKCRNNSCYIRINGLPMYITQGDTITLEDGNSLYVRTAQARVCDKRPVCDYIKDAYDKVELDVVRSFDEVGLE